VLSHLMRDFKFILNMVETTLMESFYNNDVIVISRKEYNELLLIKYQNKLYDDISNLIDNVNIDNYDFVEKKLGGCEKIIPHGRYFDLLWRLSKHRIYFDRPIKVTKTYVFYDSINNLYKIGKSVNPEIRIISLSSPVKLKIIHIIDRDVENTLHKHFKNKRIHNEWFKLTKSDIKYIKSIK
jgi:hypothetical protein